MGRLFIKDFNAGDYITGFYGVHSKAVRSTKNDKIYLDLVLVDSSGRINAKMWDNTEPVKDTFGAGDAVAIKAFVNKYQEKLQLKVDEIRKVDASHDAQYGFSWDDIMLCTKKDVSLMWNKVTNVIEQLRNPYIQKAVRRIYDKYEQEIQTYPAAQILHHSYRGGLLEHTYNMILLAEGVTAVYPEAEKDLVMSGVFLHDIGKVKELSPGVSIRYTNQGNFVGHLVLGRDIFLEAAADIIDFPSDIRLKMEHIILAHQGKLEWASPREPGILEAQLVFHIDEMDTRVKQMENALANDTSDSDWTTKQNYFGRPLYKGDLTKDE